jgi:hypothetical protein
MGSKTKTTQTTNNTQTNAPPSFTAPGLTLTADMVTQALQNLPTTAYGGPMVAQPGNTAGVVDAYGSAANTAGTMSSWLQDQLPTLQTQPQFSTTLPTARYDAGNGTDLTPAINAAIHPVFQQLTEQVLPGIRSSALESGAYSGDRAMSVVPGQAIDAANESAQRIAATLGYEDYQAREERRLRGFAADEDRALAGFNADTTRGLGTGDLLTQRMGLMPELVDTILRSSSGQGDLLRIANDYQQQSDQYGIDDALARDAYSTSRPFAGLDIATQLLAALSGNYGTQTLNGTTSTVQKTGGLGPIMQGVLGAGALAAGFPGLGSALGLGGAAAGAAGGASGFMGIPLASQMFNPTGVVGPR